MKRLLTLLFLLLAFQGFAQDYKRASIWYFGDSAGVNFNTIPPSALTNGAMSTWEGCATIADTNGNLLFYTNGVKIWNKNHQFMDNGTGLLGNISSTQSAIIVPQPGNDSIFFLFNTYDNGLFYSRININLNGGLGRVVEKNVLLQVPMTEKIAGCFHSNQKDVWVVAHEHGSNNFCSYLITSDGLIKCPIISSVGLVYNNPSYGYDVGQLKISKNGTRIAVVSYFSYRIELFSFNSLTGIVSNPVTWLTTNTGSLTYGVEFSSNNKKLYVTETGNTGKYLKQFDISTSDTALINQSRVILDTFPPFLAYGLQMGIDGRIYMARKDSTFLSVIQYPDSSGFACGYLKNGLSIAPKKSVYGGLPTIISSYLRRDSLLDFSYQFLCPTNQAAFAAKNITTTPQWIITKLSSPGNWSYNNVNFNHQFDTGTYAVKLKSGTDSITKTIIVGWSGEMIVSNDTTRCQTDSILLSVQNSQAFSCITWNDTISSITATAKTNGTYRVSAWNKQGCKLSDSIRVRLFAVPPDPLVKPMPDTIIFCKGNSIALTPDSGADFHWQDGYPIASRIIDTIGLFYTTWSDSFTCKRGDTTRLIFYPATPLQNPLPDSVTFCIGQTITLNPDSGINFLWQDNYPNATRIIDSAGLFFTNWYDTNGCRMADSIRIKTYSVTKPTVQQSGDSLFAFGNFAQWQWLFNNQPLNGAIFAKYKALQNGFYKVRGTDTFSCIAVSDSVNITNVSIRQLISPNEISVFPNPVNNVLHIELNTATEKLQSVYLLNSTGQLVYCETSPNPSETAINCSAFPKGIYLLKLFTTNKTYYQKLIIE
jgi:hypothetical protein